MKSESLFFNVIDGKTPDRDIETKKVKIVCTIGPASEKLPALKQLIKNGMNVARLNFSHGDHEDHLMRLKNIRQAASETNRFIGVLQDIQGPKIRVGRFKEGQVKLKPNQKFIITTSAIDGDESKVSCTYKKLHEDVKAGHRITLDDGIIFLVVERVKGRDVHTKVIFGGVLKNNKGMNLPDTKLQVSCLTAKDREDIKFGVKNNVDFIALSFITDANDIRLVRKLLHRLTNNPPPLIAKIETQHAVENIDEIVAEADGLMVARGDLGVECPLEQVPGLQKRIIRSANRAGKFVITATQMLESMIWNPRPTRAEASDVANAVLDGSDAVMLSAETATGKFPVKTVQTMSRIILRTEQYEQTMSDIQEHRMQEAVHHISHAVTAAAVQSTNSLKAAAIVAFTQSGKTARLVSRLRPNTSIIALSPIEKICRQLSIVWGVEAGLCQRMKHTDDMPALSKKYMNKRGLWKKGNVVVMLSGTPVQKPGSTNLLKVYEVK